MLSKHILLPGVRCKLLEWKYLRALFEITWYIIYRSVVSSMKMLHISKNIMLRIVEVQNEKIYKGCEF